MGTYTKGRNQEMYDPEAIYQDADIEMIELAAAADDMAECECLALIHGQTIGCGVLVPNANQHKDIEGRVLCPFCDGTFGPGKGGHR